MREVARRLGSVWLKEVNGRRYAWFRVAFGIVAIFNIIHVWPYRAGLYSDVGIVGQEVAAAANPGIYVSVFAWMSSPGAVTAVFLVASGAALMSVAGVWVRVSAIVLFAFFLSVAHRAPIAMAGWDYLFVNFAFILMFSPLGGTWGIVGLVKGSLVEGRGEVVGREPRYGLVLLQVQVAVIYWQAVLARWGDPFWRDGEFLTYFMLSHHGRFEGGWAVEWHDTLEMLTHLTILVELALPILLWLPRMRVLGIGLGVVFHLGIAAVSVNIAMFSLTMIMSYVAFVGGKSARDEPGG